MPPSFFLFEEVFICENVWPVCYVYHGHAWCPQRLEEDVRFPGISVTDGVAMRAETRFSAIATHGLNH